MLNSDQNWNAERNGAEILLVDDDIKFADRWQRNLILAGFRVSTAHNRPEAEQILSEHKFDLVLTDVRMPAANDGLDLLKSIRSGDIQGIDINVPVVILTSVDDVSTAVNSMKLGATDYISKSAERDELIVRLHKALEQGARENRYLIAKEQLERREDFGDKLVGVSADMLRVKLEIEQVAQKNVAVLITGETGVGKEMVARAIHRISTRAQQPFIDVNCAALPDENMLQSELFGHEKGAFTGADAPRKGRFELANHGTLFLDEIGEMSRECQGKVLKALEQKTISRLGGNRAIDVDCRFVFATNRDLNREVKSGNFREDLYYRVNIFPIYVSPLRNRVDDIPPLVETFMRQSAKRYAVPVPQIETAAVELLCQYQWPGNIRELRNIIERLVIRGTNDSVITPDMIRAVGVNPQSTNTVTVATTDVASNRITLPPNGCVLEEVERELILQALNRTAWKQKDAAKLVGITEDQMNKRVKKLKEAGFNKPI
ncbi:sigma-54-dependent Fis family transcriptional regulator [Candidatus Sumerlaeota bacterium]|nr:sigma-54 dependent transcriptional regulator [Candidatus Sumerlaeales bacterium]NLD62198.1 sigma-54-dependent Fis family transcriptional regulator [Candidatus Sumerlaeota bacterium]